MGQSHSDQEIPNFFSQIVSEEPLNTLLSEEIVNLTYDQFLCLLRELNTLSKQCLDAHGKQLAFAIKKGTVSTVFWKATIQIACVRLDPSTAKIDTFRLISLPEFLKVFKTLKCQLSAAEQSKSHEELQSSLATALDSLSNESNGESSTECCICFERKQEIILPCTHSYCMKCIDEWMLMPKKDRTAIYEYLFKEGVMVAKKDYHAPKHPELENIPNLHVIKALQSLRSRGYVKEQFAWRHYYWYLTNTGIEYLRTYLHLPPEIVPSTLKRQARTETARARPTAGLRSETSKPAEDRAGYRRTPGSMGGADKKGDVGAGTGELEFRGGFGRGRAPQ